MDLSDLKTRVKYRCGWADDTTFDTDILYALNMIQREINMLLNFDELRTTTTITTVVGTLAYKLAADFLKMSQIWTNNTYDYELQRIYPHEYKNYLADVDTTRGLIHYYDIYDTEASAGDQVKKIALFPVASAATTVPYYYYKKLDDLANDTDENIICEIYPNLLIEGGAYILYRDKIYRDNPEKIAFRRNEYLRQLEVASVGMRGKNRISKVSPKRILPTEAGKLYSAQFTGYTS